MSYAIAASTLFDGESFLIDHSVIIENDEIVAVVPTPELPGDMECRKLTPGILAPGFIDIQVNGGGGIMLNNVPSRDGVDTMTQGHRPTGTTSMMPTVISDTREVQQAAGAAPYGSSSMT